MPAHLLKADVRGLIFRIDGIDMKKVLLTAVNAKYIHSNLAVYSLKACTPKYDGQIEIAEFTINHYKDYILQEIYRKKPDILAFSCYIWNMEYVVWLMENLHLVLPETKIWLGGPEASYCSRELMEEHPEITGIMQGEGERSFGSLMEYYLDGSGSLSQIPGIVYRGSEAQPCDIFENPRKLPAAYIPMDELPFVYEDMSRYANKIIYYESSRGCPFSCSYCLSSIDKRVRLRSLELVQKELQFFLDHRVPQVKFVDRTFNCNHAHAMGIWQYILEHDNGITNFHFEIEADLLTEEELELLGRMRSGLVQLEIGVQSVNPQTLEAVHRRTDFAKIAAVSRRIASGGNIHQHLDLIAGLPYEDFDSFRHSFDMVYGLHPQELQLGFLKVLKGAGIREDAACYGIIWQKQPVYEVLSTNWLSYEDILRLKGVEEMLEVYYNSQQFALTISRLEQNFSSAFDLYAALADYYEKEGLNGTMYSRLQRMEILRAFARGADPDHAYAYDEPLLRDLYLRENAKSRPSWAADQTEYKRAMVHFYQWEEERRCYLKGYEGFNWKQMSKMTHLERFPQKEGAQWLLFDYRQRSPLNNDAMTYDITETMESVLTEGE